MVLIQDLLLSLILTKNSVVLRSLNLVLCCFLNVDLWLFNLIWLYIILQHLSSVLTDLSWFLLDILVNRLATAVRHKETRVWLLPLRNYYFAVLIILNLTNRREHNQRVRRQFLEVGCLPKQQNFEHEFDAHFCKDCVDEVLLRDSEAVYVWGCCLQVLAVLRKTLQHIKKLFLYRCVSKDLASTIRRSYHCHLRLVFEQ